MCTCKGKKRIIDSDRSVVVAADVADLQHLTELASNVKGIAGISSFKLGLILGLDGLRRSVQIVKEVLGSEFPVIFDLQKAGNDIPDMGAPFAKVVKAAGADAAILFPFTGPATQKAWTEACQGEGLEVITGGMMTHTQFLHSEGGYIADDTPERIYKLACELGVQHFVVPGNRLAWVERIYGWLVAMLGEGNFVLYAPGFITQGGDISDCGKAAGPYWNAIVGSAIYKCEGMAAQREAAMKVTAQIAA